MDYNNRVDVRSAMESLFEAQATVWRMKELISGTIAERLEISREQIRVQDRRISIDLFERPQRPPRDMYDTPVVPAAY
jgi:hypothetical protein